MHDREEIGTTTPRSAFGAPDSCGCLVGVTTGDEALIICNECGSVVRRLSACDLTRVLMYMELSLDLGTALYAHCGAMNLFPGLSKVRAFVCQSCGRENSGEAE